MEEIKLGDKVKCKLIGFTGTVVARTEFINGCIQYNVLPRGDKKNKMPEDMNIDQETLEVIPAKKKKIEKSNTGGAMTRGLIRRNF